MIADSYSVYAESQEAGKEEEEKQRRGGKEQRGKSGETDGKNDPLDHREPGRYNKPEHLIVPDKAAAKGTIVAKQAEKDHSLCLKRTWDRSSQTTRRPMNR
jgi:hypothetical protein